MKFDLELESPDEQAADALRWLGSAPDGLVITWHSTQRPPGNAGIPETSDKKLPIKKQRQDATEHLMSTRTNRERLLTAMKEIERNQNIVHEWPQL